MNKLLSCRYNMDTNRVEARFADGSAVAIDCVGALSLAGMRPRQAGRLSPYKEHGAHRPMVCHKLVASLLIHKQLALFG